MKKRTSFLSIFLVIVLLLSCLSPCVLAQTEEWTPSDDNKLVYVALGDSVSRGCGATENYQNGNYSKYEHRIVDGSFPYRVALGLGINTENIKDNAAAYNDPENGYWPVCTSGQSLSATMDLLGIEDEYDDVFNTQINKYHCQILNKYYKLAKDYCEHADVITIELGMSEVLYRARMMAEKETGISLAEDMNITTEFVQAFVKHMYTGYEYWLKAYPLLLESLHEFNSDARIVIVGAYPLADNMTLTDETVLPIGTAARLITDNMNAQYEKWAEQYKENHVLYADIRNAETPGSEFGYSIFGNDFSNNINKIGHPSVEGNAYIARQVLAVLAEDQKEEKTPVTTNISFDIGHKMQVSYVLLDGKLVKDFQYDAESRILTVQNNSKKCTNITCCCIENKKLVVYTYRLSYSKDKGYTAVRLYNTQDAQKTAEKTATSIKSVATTIGNRIKSLFK